MKKKEVNLPWFYIAVIILNLIIICNNTTELWINYILGAVNAGIVLMILYAFYWSEDAPFRGDNEE
jgi:intracellular septation protein A